MKTIMSALAASLLLAGAAAPASAETDVTAIVREYVKSAASEPTGGAKARRSGQIEYHADKLPVGSGDWWRQMDREGRGGRR